MVGLAAAEAANPRKSLPKATRQVFWRIFLFYILNVFIMGLVVPSDSDVLLGASGANTKASPFVLAVELAGIRVLPHIINAGSCLDGIIKSKILCPLNLSSHYHGRFVRCK